MASLLSIILVLIVVGFALYMLQTAPIPVHPWIKTLISGIIGIALLLWVLSIFGIHTGVVAFPR